MSSEKAIRLSKHHTNVITSLKRNIINCMNTFCSFNLENGNRDNIKCGDIYT